MKEIGFDEEKEIELNILKNVDEFCRKNNLKYFLAYGTLIGAIRHKGFIPWDDDVDIQMPREDYDKLIELYNKTNSSNGMYKLISPYDKNARHSFVKIIDTRTIKIESGIKYNSDFLGIDIDIFPIDGMPDDYDKYSLWFDKLQKNYKKFNYCVSASNEGSIKYRLLICLMKILFHNKNKYLIKAKKMHSQYNLCDCEYAGTVESMFNDKKNRTLKSNFEESIDAEFEGLCFSIPKGYDDILRGIYGDYMKLPPEDKRVTHHVNNIFWKK